MGDRRSVTLFTALLAIPCLAQPPGIVYSTTVPYSGMTDNDGFSIYPNYPGPGVSLVVTDASGNSYVAGAIASTGLPTTPGVYQTQYAGGTCGYGEFSGPCPSVFIAKFNSTGALVFLTYLGGTYSSIPYGLAVDESGNIYVGVQAGVAYVAKLSADGTGLGWVTFLSSGILPQLAIAPDGSLYCLTEAALTKLNQSGQIEASLNVSFVPPSFPAIPTQALAVGADGSVYIGGQTALSYGSIAKVNPSLSGFAWSTSVDGSVGLVEPAPDGTLWISGTTNSSSFPVLAGAFQSELSPGGGYLVHLSADGSKALASTYLPATLTSLALDGTGNVIFSAVAQRGFQATPGAQWPCPQSVFGDAFFTSGLGFFGKIDSAGHHLLWGTWDGPLVPIGPVAVDQNGNAIAAGNLTNQEDITLTALTTIPGPPRLVETCIAQSGSPNNYGPLAPGEIFSIYGAGFGPDQGVAAQLLEQPTGNSIGTELGGVQVLIEDTPVPLLYVSSAQINLVAPYLLNGRTAAHIKIVTADATSNQVVLGVRPSAPEIFLNPSAAGELGAAAILNQDGTVNSSTNPAHIGDTVSMFVSGVGQTTPPGVDGAIPQAAGGTPVLPILVQLNLLTFAEVTYAGNAPGLVSGVTQVNFQLPPLNRAGPSPPYQALIVLYAGGASSNPDDSRADTNIWFE